MKTEKLRILHINTRQDRGGSAIFMKNLGNALSKKGIHNLYFALEKKSRTFTLNNDSSLIPYMNYLSHLLIGRDVFTVFKKKLNNYVKNTDIIHLHVIHSYFINYKYLFKLIKKYNKPVVVTLHDKWFFTGRCAIPISCNQNINLCIKCPHKNIYPKSFAENTNKNINLKFNFYREYIANITFISPSIWLKNSIENTFPEFEITHIPNGVNIYFDQKVTSEKGKNKLLFIANDFNDANKVNYQYLNNLIKMDLPFTLVGKNQPFFENKNVYAINRIISNMEVQQFLNETKCFILLSIFENYPTILIEALVNGCCILTTKNLGATEILRKYSFGIDYLFVEDISEIDVIQFLNKNDITKCENRKKYSAKIFDIDETAKQYIEVYQKSNVYC